MSTAVKATAILITRSCLLVLACMCASMQAGASSLEALQPDESVYGFSLPDFSDRKHALQDYRGKVVLVNFWASWCPPCIHEMPELKQLKQTMAGKAFEIIALNVGEKKYKVRKFAKLIKLDLPILLDTSSDVFKNWGVKTLPTSFLIDATGKARYRVQGNPGWSSDSTLNTINKLLTESQQTLNNNELNQDN